MPRKGAHARDLLSEHLGQDILCKFLMMLLTLPCMCLSAHYSTHTSNKRLITVILLHFSLQTVPLATTYSMSGRLSTLAWHSTKDNQQLSLRSRLLLFCTSCFSFTYHMRQHRQLAQVIHWQASKWCNPLKHQSIKHWHNCISTVPKQLLGAPELELGASHMY